MKLYAFIYAVLVLRVHSASLKPSADKILDDPDNIEFGNVVNKHEMVEHKLKTNDAVIPVAVVGEKPLKDHVENSNDIVPDNNDGVGIKKVEEDLNPDLPPLDSIVQNIKSGVVDTFSILYDSMRGVVQDVQNGNGPINQLIKDIKKTVQRVQGSNSDKPKDPKKPKDDSKNNGVKENSKGDYNKNDRLESSPPQVEDLGKDPVIKEANVNKNIEDKPTTSVSEKTE